MRRYGLPLANIDWTFLVLVLLISAIGVLNIYSTGFSVAGGKTSTLYVKQIQSFLIGFIAMILTFSFDYRRICTYAYVIYCLSVALLVIVSLYGYTTHGSQRWIIVAGFSFQPSELMKLSLILALARYFNDHRSVWPYSTKEIIPPALLVAVPFFLILRQPDLGTALILFIVFVSAVLFVGVRWLDLLTAAVGFLIMLPVGWFFLKDYQKERVLTFFNPDRDPFGSGYHIIQSMIAVGSGGLLGKGFLKGTQTQLKFLPEQHTDFIFSAFAEEWGFLGSIFLLILFTLLILWILKIARHSRDYLGTLIAYGFASLIFWGVMINIGMVLGIVPVVGIPLPFFSYGGSAVVVLMMGVGILLNISAKRFILQS